MFLMYLPHERHDIFKACPSSRSIHIYIHILEQFNTLIGVLVFVVLVYVFGIPESVNIIRMKLLLFTLNKTCCRGWIMPRYN